MHQRGLRPSHSVARRSRVLIGNAQYLPAREAIITADDYVYQRGVKRSFGDDDDTGDHSYPLEFPGTAANGRKGTPEQLENNRRLAQRGSDGGLVQHVGSTAECHRGYSVRRAGDSDEVAHGASDDGAVQAELRAEILNGVRHLLHNESEIDCLVQLCSLLKEKNTALLERAIHRRGVAECVGLLEETLKIEAIGGMLTKEGRRRTPGGVFLRLLQDRIPREDKRFIWDEQNREQRRLKRQRIRSQKAAKVSVRPHEKLENSVSTAIQHPAELPECDELEPGELGAAELRPIDGA
ncbi:hypothetical protein, conserved [Eimeria tenella]|uniref:Phosphorylated adapter RNA export protein n=1 Tax=Eimeria tenella TaxID=5802 RepID=U6KT14_EIMTE|nr:hypothetical protein, conserved [Eimeria tenella]CDJ41106.1 hypothetical protein, conserved [Eimeria tenella]|eukprot:XP_013231856.1 hypothetical protein, conserved [Eimeria tenella]